MMTAPARLSDDLQALVDARLDTIERMLLGHTPRADRRAIVDEVEAEIFERLGERPDAEPGRDDVLAVLARLDPPEAYLAETAARPGVARGEAVRRSPTRRPPDSSPRPSTASLILGIASASISATASLLLALAFLLEAEGLFIASSLLSVIGLISGFGTTLLATFERFATRPSKIGGIAAICSSVLASLCLVFFACLALS